MEQQGGFTEGRVNIDQIFRVKLLTDKYMDRGQKLYSAVMDLGRVYWVDRKALWEVLRIL